MTNRFSLRRDISATPFHPVYSNYNNRAPRYQAHKVGFFDRLFLISRRFLKFFNFYSRTMKVLIHFKGKLTPMKFGKIDFISMWCILFLFIFLLLICCCKGMLKIPMKEYILLRTTVSRKLKKFLLNRKRTLNIPLVMNQNRGKINYLNYLLNILQIKL